jgi:acetyltransferase-like isoleucine patch superfamily enzyme
LIIEDKKDWFTFKMNSQVHQALEEAKIYFSLEPGTYRFREGELILCKKGALVEPYVIFAANAIVETGFASYVASRFEPELKMGRYCSIAPNVQVMNPSHPLDRVTTNSITYGDWTNMHVNPRKELGGSEMKLRAVKQKPQPVIEHDVWIGQDALLTRGITLGWLRCCRCLCGYEVGSALRNRRREPSADHPVPVLR